MKDKSKHYEINKPLSINNFFNYTKSDRDSTYNKNNFEKDSIIKKIISNADEGTDSLSNSEISFNFSQTMSGDLSIHSLRISKQSFVDSILTLPSRTYQNNREEKSSERKEPESKLQMRSPSSSVKKDSSRKKGNNTDRVSPDTNSKNNHNVDPNAADSIINVNTKRTKGELTERSIFYTPSTICNYYLQSQEVTPNKTITDSNNKKSDRTILHKFKLNFKNLNLINITNSNNNCNSSNSNSNNYEENITENNENICSSSRLNVNNFEKRTPIKYIKTQMGMADSKSRMKDEKSFSHFNPFNNESSPSVVSNLLKKHLNISEIEIEDRSIDINEEMTIENKSMHPLKNNLNFEKKNLNLAFDQIKKMDDNYATGKGNSNNIHNINLNIIRNENFSFDMTNKESGSNNNIIKNEANLESKENNKNGITVKIENFTIHNNSINNKFDNVSHSMKNSKANRFDYETLISKNNKKKSHTNRNSTPLNKTIKSDKQSNSYKTRIKTSAADDLISTTMPSSSKSIHSLNNKVNEFRAFDYMTGYDSKVGINKEEEKSKKVMNINLSKININNLVKPGFNSNKLNKNTKTIQVLPLVKRNEHLISKSPSSLYDKSLSLTKLYTAKLNNFIKFNTIVNNKYKSSSSQISKEKKGLNTIDSKIKSDSQFNKKRIITIAEDNKDNIIPAIFSSAAIKKIINENILRNNLAPKSRSKKFEGTSEKTESILFEDKTLKCNLDSKKFYEMKSDRNNFKKDSLKIITDFSRYKKPNRDFFECIPKKVIMKDACLQTSPCRTLEDESNFKSYFKDREMNETRVDKIDLKLNNEIVFSKLVNPKGDDADDMELNDD